MSRKKMILPKSNDNYIISYPKCGRTWMRALLGKFLYLNFGIKNEGRMIKHYHDYILTTANWHKDIRDINEIWFSSDHIINEAHLSGSASDISDNKSNYKNTKVVFLVRDPRDVLISYFFHIKRRKRKGGFKGSIGDYILWERGGMDCIIRFYNIWYEQRGVPRDFMLLRYEDLRVDTEKEIKRLLEFFDVKIKNPQFLTSAIEFSSFKNMQNREKNGVYKDKTLSAKKIRDPESFKVRKGKVGGYKDYLDDRQIEYLDKKMKNLNPFFGYKIGE